MYLRRGSLPQEEVPQPGCGQPSLLQGHTADLHSAISTKTAVFSPEKLFIVAWVYSSPRVGHCISFVELDEVSVRSVLLAVLPFSIWTI